MNDMMQMFTQMMTMPMNMMETFTRSMQSSCPVSQTCLPAPCPEPCVPVACEPVKEAPWRCCDSDCRCDGNRCHESCGCRSRDYRRCCDSDCRCDGDRCHERCPCRSRVYHHGSDRVKLVEYSVASVRRGARRPPDYGQQLFSGCATHEEITNEVITRYVKKHCDQPVDGKDLRVYTKVLDTWCKPEFDFEEEQIETLRGIRRAIAGK